MLNQENQEVKKSPWLKIGHLLKKCFLIALSWLFHLLAISLIVYFVWPIADWYLKALPAKGVDLYLSGSYVAHLLKYFSFRFNGWKEIWFSGIPYARDYPSYYFYLMVPLAKHFGLIKGIQWFAVITLFVFSAFSYLLYYQLSKNRALAVVLTLATVFSANLYRALVWAGGIPFWATQAFFPIVTLFVVKYCQGNNQKWLFLAALAAGLGILGHPQSFQNFILPAATLIFLGYRPGLRKVSLKKRILDLAKFNGLIILISCSYVVDLIPSYIATLIAALSNLISLKDKIMIAPTSTGGAVPLSTVPVDMIRNWTNEQFKIIWSQDTNVLIWYFLIISSVSFLISLLLRKKRLKALLSLLSFALISGWAIGLIYLFSRGIDILLVSGWYKVFWMPLVAVATGTAFCWGEAKKIFQERKLLQTGVFQLLRKLGGIATTFIFIAAGYYYLPPVKKVIERLEKISNYSSAHPFILSAKTKPEELLLLREKLKPNLMSDDSYDYRLYVVDAAVNIWWAALEDMALTRGYVDPPITNPERWGLFWLDSVLGPSVKEPKSSLIVDWKVPEWAVDNMTRFLIDWYATKYLEGDHLTLASPTNLAANITASNLIEAKETVTSFGAIINYMYPTEAWSDQLEQNLNFYKIKSELVSPILMAVNAAPVLHLGDNNGYETLTRFLGMMNLGPRNIILARGPQYIDELSYEELVNFEALILYQYDYHNFNKAWRLISKYVEKGGKVYIETGTETKESNTVKTKTGSSSDLPGILPIKRTVREHLGRDWEFKVEKNSLTQGVDFSKFSPLIFDNDVWNVSHPPTEDDIREDTQVILRQKGMVVAAERKIGEGRLIWSGFNLPYHIIRDYNSEEGKFLKNILAEMVDLNGGQVAAKTTRISPKERLIETERAKGVLFKEQDFPRWQASGQGKKYKIYKAGPSSPGFMYVRLPENFSGQVRFKYLGSLKAKFYALVSTLTVAFILDYITGLRVLIAVSRMMFFRLKRRFSYWWEKDNEY